MISYQFLHGADVALEFGYFLAAFLNHKNMSGKLLKSVHWVLSSEKYAVGTQSMDSNQFSIEVDENSSFWRLNMSFINLCESSELR